MGHSIAGLYLRDYAARYPQNVAGLVFVDATTPFLTRNPAFASAIRPPPTRLFEAAMILGIPRVIGMCSSPGKDVQADSGKLEAEDRCRLHYSALAGELNSIDASSQEIASIEKTNQTEPYGSLPILIFSHDPVKMLTPPHTTGRDIARQAAWTQMQEDLKKLSTRSRRIIAKGSAHNIPTDRPDLIERKVSLFIEQIRGTAPQPMNYGSTTTE